MHGRIAGLAALAMILGGCGTAPSSSLPAPPAPVTRATLAGPLCQGSACRCAQDPSQVGTPPEGYKRFEVLVGPSDNELWATVDGMVLYKSVQRASECFYVDLQSPGEHPVTLRAKGDSGFGARIKVRELAPEGAGWYDTFDFFCGAPGACRADQLRDFRASLEQYPRQIHDPCGSVKIRRLRWETGRIPDGLVPTNLHLQLALKIYGFTPSAPPGDATCAGNF